MSKIAILGDTHFGCSNSNIILHEYMKSFYKDFFDYIDKNNIRTILQLGDLFDVRKHINTWSLNFFREVFLKPVIERDLHVIVLLGNHDIFYRESLEISSVEEVLRPYEEWFTIIKEPRDCYIEDKSFLIVPWVCKENTDLVNLAIENSTSQYCAGHFEFNGFELFKGQYAKTHYDHKAYQKFKKVFSGHFHHMSSQDNVLYTGTPYELTWNDCNTTKGFFVLSDDNLELVENEHYLFSSFKLSDYAEIPIDVVNKKHVKLTIDTQLDVKERETLINNIYSMQPYSLKLIEIKKEVATEKVVYNATTSIGDLIEDYVNNIKVSDDVEKTKLSSILMSMYVEANSNAN